MSTTREEQRGLAKVHNVCAEMEAIWRPTPNVDVGIDGQIEFLELGTNISSGKIIAVQVKSGVSYFKYQTDDHVVFRIQARHRRYWSLVNLPVLLILHHHERDLTLYAFMKQQLARGGQIVLRIQDRFEPHAREHILEGYKEEAREIRRLIQPDRILQNFGEAFIRDDPRRIINGLHFLLSCIDPKYKYFELRYVRLVAGLSVADKSAHLSGAAFHEFIQRCVVKCWGFELVESFEQEFEHAWYEMGMMPDIAVPLTGKGRYVARELLHNLGYYLLGKHPSEYERIKAREFAAKIIEESQKASDRLDESDRLGDYWL